MLRKKILVGVTGGIAAYKSAGLIRRLREAGAEVRVVMTEAAKAFITPLTLQAVSQHRVADDLLSEEAEAGMGHIELARWADFILVAPASADFMARLAHGHANDLLSTLCLATTAPIAIAPAMNREMWLNAITQENLQRLKAHDVKIFGPSEGEQACGEVGPGRMLESHELVTLIARSFRSDMLAGKKIMITVGPTREMIDPMRYISNRSSGKMGYALAEVAYEMGAEVTLVAGPCNISSLKGIHRVDVISAQQMYDAVMHGIRECDVFIGAAAVADYRAASVATQKIKKSSENIGLTLTRTPDIIAAVAALPNKPFVIGFAAESENVIDNARIKLKAKNLNLIVANQIDQAVDCNDSTVTALWPDGKTQAFVNL